MNRIIILFITGSWLGATASAEILISGDAAFVSQISECLERFSAADPETREILDKLRQPRPAAPRHTLQRGPAGAGNLATTIPDNAQDGSIQPGGGNGPGTGTTITLDPSIPADEFCAILLHELKHAYDYQHGADKKTQPPRPEPGAGIPEAEIDAMREENRYRKHSGLPQIRDYGGTPLPPSAVF